MYKKVGKGDTIPEWFPKFIDLNKLSKPVYVFTKRLDNRLIKKPKVTDLT